MTDHDPPAVLVENAAGASSVFLLCEHASNHIPSRYQRLGLTEAALARHIAYDIGAAAVARGLSRRLDAPLVSSGFSRLLIDCNRPLDAPSSIPVRSEATDIPGNVGIDAAERAERDARFFKPFRDTVAAMLDARMREGRPTLLIGMHSFTPVYLGVPRVWQAGFLYLRARRLGRALIAALSAHDAALTVGDNQPYEVTLDTDYTVPHQGDVRGIPTALIEVRQDLIGHDDGVAAWGETLARVLALVAADIAAVTQPAGEPG